MSTLFQNIKKAIATLMLIITAIVKSYAQTVPVLKDSTAANKTVTGMFNEIKNIAETQDSSSMVAIIAVGGVLLLVGFAMYLNNIKIKPNS